MFFLNLKILKNWGVYTARVVKSKELIWDWKITILRILDAPSNIVCIIDCDFRDIAR